MRKTNITLLVAAVTVASTVGAQGTNPPPQIVPGVPPPQTTAPETSTTPAQTPSAPPSQTPAETHAAPPVAPPTATQKPAEVGASRAASPETGVSTGATQRVGGSPQPASPQQLGIQRPSAVPSQLNTPTGAGGSATPAVPSAPGAPVPGGQPAPVKR
jgi:hypothetical protein